jgi:hypothetical protein
MFKKGLSVSCRRLDFAGTGPPSEIESQSEDSLSKKSPLCTLSRYVWCANLPLSLAQKSVIIIFIVNVAVGTIC